MTTIKTIKKLFDEAYNLIYSEKSGMVKIPEMLEFGFFPGGQGICTQEGDIYGETDSLERKNIMVIGQDWGNLQGYQEDAHKDREEREKNPTWKNLLELLKECGIEKGQCFFTNAFMGLRKEGKNIGKSPAWSDPKFVRDCQDFFLKQLSTADFKLVLVMGKEVAHFIAAISDNNFPKKFKAWGKINTIKELYETEKNHSIVHNNIVFQFITHTCLNKSNLSMRWKEKEKGYGFELEKKCVRKAFEDAFKNNHSLLK